MKTLYSYNDHYGGTDHSDGEFEWLQLPTTIGQDVSDAEDASD